jgi:hypothetical protein
MLYIYIVENVAMLFFFLPCRHLAAGCGEKMRAQQLGAATIVEKKSMQRRRATTSCLSLVISVV